MKTYKPGETHLAEDGIELTAVERAEHHGCQQCYYENLSCDNIACSDFGVPDVIFVESNKL